MRDDGDLFSVVGNEEAFNLVQWLARGRDKASKRRRKEEAMGRMGKAE